METLVSRGRRVFWLDFIRFYLDLLGFTGFYWVLLGFTGFYWVLLGLVVALVDAVDRVDIVSTSWSFRVVSGDLVFPATFSTLLLLLLLLLFFFFFEIIYDVGLTQTRLDFFLRPFISWIFLTWWNLFYRTVLDFSRFSTGFYWVFWVLLGFTALLGGFWGMIEL